MNYIIMDLEWNQAVSAARMIRTPVMLHGEIIQIGAIKTDDKFNIIDKIKINVRPKYYKIMNSHVEKLTGITQSQLAVGETFPQAFRRFKTWCEGDREAVTREEFRFITWGFDDLGVFADNLSLHGLDPSFGADYINLQLIYNRQTNAEHLQCALSAAAESLGIPLDVQCHDAFNDAYLTWELCRKLDMALGLAEYSEYVAALPTPLVKDAVQGVDDLKKMLFNRRVVEIPCPDCGKKLKHGQWLFSSGKSCKTISQCTNDRCNRSTSNGNFLIKLKAARVSDNNYTVTRAVFAASDEDIAAFNEKLKKREERRRKAKAAENTEDNNDKNNTHRP